jgi:hypothetical protein
MANYRAISSGVWSDLARWEDDSLGYFSASSVLPTSADDVYANNFTVTIDGTRNAFTIRHTAFIPPTNLGAMSIPQMTSNTTPSGTAAASSLAAGSAAWFAFERTGTVWTSAAVAGQWLSYEFPIGKIIKRYGFSTGTNTAQFPRTWTFEGSNNGSTWTTLDTQTNFVAGPNVFYSFDISVNTTSYTYYRINVSAVSGGGTNNTTIVELEMSEVTNLYGSIVAGGGFTFANGGNLTCSAPTNSVFNRAVSGVYCLTFDLPSGQSATFNGSVNEVPFVANGRNILVQNTGTFNMVGNYDMNTTAQNGRNTIFVNASTTINIVGNINCSQASVNNNTGTLYLNGGTPTVNITGNVSGGASNNIGLAFGNGIVSIISSTINITGNITTNSCPSIYLNANVTLNLIGNATGGTSFPAVLNATTACTIDILGITTSGSGYPAIQGLATTFVKVRGNVVNTDTYCAIYAGRVVIDDNVTSWQFKDSTNTITRTLYTAGVDLGNPAEDDVREGVDYGTSLELTGTLAVPTADNVRKGVPIDDTVGTADLTAEDFLTAIEESTLDIAERLRNVATVQTTGDQITGLS